jgi:DNA-binding CsgD family transcriptional regulator
MPRRKTTAVSDPSADRPALRKTGIRVIGEMPWGAHISVFYEKKEDLLDTVAVYFQAGLESNEFCVWATSDPVTVEEGTDFLRANIPDFDKHMSAGRIEILPGHDWYLKDDQFNLKKITGGWNAKLREALAKHYDGLRISGNAFWIETNYWKDFCEYERDLDETLAGQNMIVMCTYSLPKSRAVDILDVIRVHNFSVARRNGNWEFLESPELRQATQEIQQLHRGLDILSRPFPGQELLTSRERVVLAQIVRGASSKEVARALTISPRTVDFHRNNILKKLGAKNAVDLVRIILGKNGTD